MAAGIACEEHGLPASPDAGDLLRCSEVIDEMNDKTPVPIKRRTDLESGDPVKALRDPVLLKDHRVLQNLLRTEDRYLPGVPDYFKTVQKGSISPPMRKIVGDWMLQLCQELRCQPEVFCLAMNYMDRFLARIRVDKSKLQLLGAVCLLVSSKFRETRPIVGERLIFYTDFSITSEEIKDWELLLLQTLTWELSAVTPLDFLDQVIHRLGLNPSVDLDSLKQKAETIIVLSILEYKFSYLTPSLLGSAGLFAALKCLSNDPKTLIKDISSFREIKIRLQTLTHVISNDLDVCMAQMEAIVPDYLKANTSSVEMAFADSTTTTTATCSSSSLSSSPTDSEASSSVSSGIGVIPGDFQSLPIHNQNNDLTSTNDTYSILVS